MSVSEGRVEIKFAIHEICARGGAVDSTRPLIWTKVFVAWTNGDKIDAWISSTRELFILSANVGMLDMLDSDLINH